MTPDLEIVFDSKMSLEECKEIVQLLEDYYKACGGAGFVVEYTKEEA